MIKIAFRNTPLHFIIHTLLLSGLLAPMPALSRTIYLFDVEKSVHFDRPAHPGDKFRLQLGSFRNKSYALGLKKSYHATLSPGPVWEHTEDTQTFYLAPSIEKTYAAHRSSNALIDDELFLGIQKPLCEQLESQADIGYEFADWGRNHLNKAPGQTLHDGLSLSHLYTNGYLLTPTYLG